MLCNVHVKTSSLYVKLFSKQSTTQFLACKSITITNVSHFIANILYFFNYARWKHNFHHCKRFVVVVALVDLRENSGWRAVGLQKVLLAYNCIINVVSRKIRLNSHIFIIANGNKYFLMWDNFLKVSILTARWGTLKQT